MSHEADTAYYGSKFKCPFPGCHDTERHTHAQPAWEAALTESRREVELLRGVYKRECEKNGTGALVAENATLRQEVEVQKGAALHCEQQLIDTERVAKALRRQVEEQAASLESIAKAIPIRCLCLPGTPEHYQSLVKMVKEMVRQVEEQAAKLADYKCSGEFRNCDCYQCTVKRLDHAESSLVKAKDDYDYLLTKRQDAEAKLMDEKKWSDIYKEKGEKYVMEREQAESSLAAAQAALRAKDKAMEVARKWATNRRAHEVAEELARAIAVTPSPADGEPSFTMEELKAMKAKLDEPFPAPSEPKEGA
jgi:hypothetical protein